MHALPVVLATDAAYAPYAVVTLHSAKLALTPGCRLHATILDGGLGDECRRWMRKQLEDDRLELHFFDAKAHWATQSLRGMRHWSEAMFYRFMIGRAVPVRFSRAVYLDCDLLVLASLHELFAVDLGGAWVAAVEDPSNARRQLLEITRSPFYFNSGVLLIDLEVWRSERLEEHAISLGEELGDLLLMPDQDILNKLLDGHIHHLPPLWNLQVEMYRIPRYWRHLRSNPNIVHFTTNLKPWMGTDPHPYAALYRRVAASCGVPTEDRVLSAKFVLRWARRFGGFAAFAGLRA